MNVTLCDGACGRPGTMHMNNGATARDRRHLWCDRCRADLAAGRMPRGLIRYEPYVLPPLPSGPGRLS